MVTKLLIKIDPTTIRQIKYSQKKLDKVIQNCHFSGAVQHNWIVEILVVNEL